MISKCLQAKFKILVKQQTLHHIGDVFGEKGLEAILTCKIKCSELRKIQIKENNRKIAKRVLCFIIVLREK